jgi:dihydrofolate reductase
VLTRDPGWSAAGVLVAGTFEEALRRADELSGDVMVAGGGRVYAEALPWADEQVLTEVPASPEGDVRYPDFDRSEWVEVQREPHDGYDLVRWERT